MSELHRELGHFSEPVQRQIKRMYSHICALCDRPGASCDHIFPLNFAEYAHLFGVADIHGIDNGWLLCRHCHHAKSVAENDAYPDGAKMSVVYNRYWKMAFTPRGTRRLKNVTREQVNRKGLRAERSHRLIGNRLKVALKKAREQGNQKDIDRLTERLREWRENTPRLRRA